MPGLQESKTRRLSLRAKHFLIVGNNAKAHSSGQAHASSEFVLLTI